MSRTDFPPCLLTELVQARFGNWSTWMIGDEPTERTQVAFLGKYKVHGFVDYVPSTGTEVFMITSWDIVIPLTAYEIRLNEALDLLSTVRRLVPEEHVIYKDLGVRIDKVLTPDA